MMIIILVVLDHDKELRLMMIIQKREDTNTMTQDVGKDGQSLLLLVSRALGLQSRL